MKLSQKLTVMGLLLVAGTIVKAANPTDEVKAALVNLIDTSGNVTDSTLSHYLGSLDVSSPGLISWGVCPMINSALANKATTKDYTSRSGILGLNLLPSITTINVDYDKQTAVKYVAIREKNQIICGIKFTLNAKKWTATYIDKDAVRELNEKTSYYNTENGFSLRQLPIEWIAGIAAVAGLCYGGYKLYNWNYARLTGPLLAQTASLAKEIAAIKAAQEAAAKAAEEAVKKVAGVATTTVATESQSIAQKAIGLFTK